MGAVTCIQRVSNQGRLPDHLPSCAKRRQGEQVVASAVARMAAKGQINDMLIDALN